MIVRWEDVKNCLEAFENLNGWQEVESQEESFIREQAYQWLKALEAAYRESFERDLAQYAALALERDELLQKNTDLRRLNKEKKDQLDVVKRALAP